MTITPILWVYDQLEDGTYSLKIRHSYIEGTKKMRKYYPINIYLHKWQWDEKKQRVKLDQHPNYAAINLKLNEIENTVEREYLKDRSVNIGALIKSILDPNYKHEHTPLSYLNLYIDQCREGKILHYKTKQKLTEGYIKTINTCKNHFEWYLQQYSLSPSFNDITEDFHDQWMHALRYEYPVTDELTGLAENTMAKTTKNFKTVMEHAMRKAKLHTNVDYMDFPAIWHESDNIALDDKEVQSILNVDLSEYPHLIEEQNRFAIAYNFLLRFHDSISIDKKHIFMDDGRPFLRMTTQKTKEEVIIPIMPRNFQLLKRYKFQMPATTNQTSNEKLKTIGLLAKVNRDQTVKEFRKGKVTETIYKRYQLITTHTTRRSAATNLYLAGVDLKTIQLMGGWKSMAQLEKYIKVDKLQSAKKIASHPFFNM